MPTRHPLRHVLGTVRTTLAVVLLGLLAGVWSPVRGRGPLATSRAAQEQCRAAYAQARSARDSAMVDVVTPVTSRGQAAFAKSCALIRTDGDFGPAGRSPRRR